MSTRVAEQSAVRPSWFAGLVTDPAGTAAFLAEVADRVARRAAGHVLVVGDDPGVGEGLTRLGYPASVTGLDTVRTGPRGRRVDVVYLGADRLSRLGDQRDQLRLVRRLAALLRPGGALVIQHRHPDPAEWDGDPAVVGFDATRQSLLLADHPGPLRYVWPAELDLLAELAELALDARWGGWYGEPVRCGGAVVSVYRS
ncbi:hypothetical protein [Actinokineospora enzanensis]|uniref:hypothetical protein n=1 Tax=Actinokineospora enzanensis TaxID=155975 RepID=UPI00036C95CB|nr:hypothetical protein [Actinokineospora enzanensis]